MEVQDILAAAIGTGNFSLVLINVEVDFGMAQIIAAIASTTCLREARASLRRRQTITGNFQRTYFNDFKRLHNKQWPLRLKIPLYNRMVGIRHLLLTLKINR